ncbi:MAG TPA: peptidoglycan DD-metalloendopeptidase family protein [Flavihumibacter sp.]
MTDVLLAAIRKNQYAFHPVVPFDPSTDRLAPFDLREGGDMPVEVLEDPEAFMAFPEKLRQERKARYLIGGYNELRVMYSRSDLFDAETEPRRLHIGTDIWAPAGNPVYAFWGGMVHSVGWNDRKGDYGATLILLHQLEGVPFYTLYGHLSKRDIDGVYAGQYVIRGQEIAHFGEPAENGNWPPHLHFQIIRDMELREGDYPGVVKPGEAARWLANCPDPDLILQLNKYL